MSLFLITGLPGTGKSTVCAELKLRGIEAYDGDYDGLAHWFDTDGRPVSRTDELRTPEFLQTHSRDIARPTIENLATKGEGKQVFICADPENEEDLHDLFTNTFALILDEPTRQHRLDTRQNNQWGKLPHEKEHDLAIKDIAYDRYKRLNYTMINSDQPVARIVDIITKHIQEGY